MELSKMTAAEKKEMLMTAIEISEISPSQYDKMIYMRGMIEIESGPTVLENGIVLEDIILQWAKLINPEKLARVLSALRDCEDATRRTRIMYKMIQKMHEPSQAGGLSEAEWPSKVECKLRRQ